MDFTENFADVDHDVLANIKITRLPSHGYLELLGVKLN